MMLSHLCDSRITLSTGIGRTRRLARSLAEARGLRRFDAGRRSRLIGFTAGRLEALFPARRVPPAFDRRCATARRPAGFAARLPAGLRRRLLPLFILRNTSDRIDESSGRAGTREGGTALQWHI
jgi:hypothetical protein